MKANISRCDVCNTIHDSQVFTVSGRGYGSRFDGDTFSFSVCPRCMCELRVNPDWFNNEVCYCPPSNQEWLSHYLHENALERLILTLSHEKQEAIVDCYNALLHGLNP